MAVYYNGEYTALRYRQYKIHWLLYEKWNSALMLKPPKRLLVPAIYNLRADPKERYNLLGGTEGIVWSLAAKDAQIRAGYEKSFKEFPNNDYSKMKRSE